MGLRKVQKLLFPLHQAQPGRPPRPDRDLRLQPLVVRIVDAGNALGTRGDWKDAAGNARWPNGNKAGQIRQGDGACCRAGDDVLEEGQQIVAFGPSLAAVVTQAREAGVAVPYVFRVEDFDEDSATLGL